MISSEMNKILIFVANMLVCIGFANAAVRDGTAISRNKSEKNTQSRVSTVQPRTNTARTTTIIPRATTTPASVRGGNVINRTQSKSTITRSATTTQTPRALANVARQKPNRSLTARVATNTDTSISNTRTGAEYEQCKNTYFSCMDQFCSLKNDDYRRCSCNDRVFDLTARRETLQSAGEQLTIFTENLDVVGMTAAQATAMRTESDGEAALKSDTSSSKALLQAIMNSIRGEDSTVGGKFTDLNSINISFDTVNAFGMTDVGQAIASYNGVALYNAVYPQCRDAVRADCNDASLQRAITAYLMAIEQDCNTVQTALDKTQQDIKSAIREGSAMLDLARIKNRQKHNSSDITTCINAVETAILSEEVCGANYHKCLDNGEFIDISTGQPIAGVENFYELENLLTFNAGIDAAHQKLTQNTNNRKFIQHFENRVKKFAQPALDKCVEDADQVWAEYLDIAMLDIYYAQRSKVDEIKQSCFDYISSCYMNGDTAIDAGLSNLTGDSKVVLQPDAIALNNQMCTEYVTACDNMFDGNIIAQYIENRQETDQLTACRAVAKQCFDKYGGTNYENFYYPYSGLFTIGHAPDWFTLYEYDTNGKKIDGYKSECAKQLANIDACNTPEIIEMAFGGLDYYAKKDGYEYGLAAGLDSDNNPIIKQRYLRPTGVATEIYNNVLSVLSTQCMNVDGRFVEYQQLKPGILQNQDNLCEIIETAEIYNTPFNYNVGYTIANTYGLIPNENMCPRDYILNVDTKSWGICSCWENGARRSKNGKSAKCMTIMPTTKSRTYTYTETVTVTNTTKYVSAIANDEKCVQGGTLDSESQYIINPTKSWAMLCQNDNHQMNCDFQTIGEITEYNWCTQDVLSSNNQVCPISDGDSKFYVQQTCDEHLGATMLPHGIE